MAKMTAAERYAARKIRVALSLRRRTIEAAETAARHARMRERYGEDWQGRLLRSVNIQMNEWNSIVERNPYRSPTDPDIGWSLVRVRPYLRPANPGRGRGVV